MKVIVLDDFSTGAVAGLISRLATVINAHGRSILDPLRNQLVGPDKYVAVDRDDDLPLILELLEFEKETAEEQLRDYETNNPEHVESGKERLAGATEVLNRLREQL